MLRLSFCSLMLLALSCAPYETVGSRTYYGLSIGVSNAPPPPRVVLVEGPSLVLVPGTSVYVIENSGYDAFRYGVTSTSHPVDTGTALGATAIRSASATSAACRARC